MGGALMETFRLLEGMSGKSSDIGKNEGRLDKI
jgi:hypothetical protein